VGRRAGALQGGSGSGKEGGREERPRQPWGEEAAPLLCGERRVCPRPAKETLWGERWGWRGAAAPFP